MMWWCEVLGVVRREMAVCRPVTPAPRMMIWVGGEEGAIVEILVPIEMELGVYGAFELGSF